MSTIQKPRIGARILASHPLARGLIHDWLLNEGAGQGQGAPFTDYANPRTGGLLGAGSVGTTTGTYWRQGQRGSYIYTDPTGTGTVNSVTMPVGDASGSGGPPGNVFSWASRILITSFSAYQSLFGPTAVVASVDIRTNPSAQIEFLKGTVAVIATSTGTIPANTWIDVGISYDGTNAVIYINGVASGSASSAQTFVASQYAIFGGTESPPPAGSAVEWVRMWNRVLSPSEFLDLAARPFALYRQPQRRRIGLASSVTTAFLSGTSRVLGSARSSPAATATVAATTRVETTSRVAPAAQSSVLARSSAQTTGRGQLTAASTIAARSLAETAGRAANAAQAPVSARSNEMTGARAPTAPLARLPGASKASGFGRTQGSATATITGRAATTAVLKGPASPRAAFAAASRAMVGGLANPIATTSIVAIAARVGAITAGRAQTSATAGIAATSRVTNRAKGTLVAIATIAARSRVVGASIGRLAALAGIAAHSRAMTRGGATIASTVAMAFLSAVTRMATSGRAAFWSYVPRRTVTLPPDVRTTTLPIDARVKQLPGDR